MRNIYIEQKMASGLPHFRIFGDGHVGSVSVLFIEAHFQLVFDLKTKKRLNKFVLVQASRAECLHTNGVMEVRKQQTIMIRANDWAMDRFWLIVCDAFFSGSVISWMTKNKNKTPGQIRLSANCLVVKWWW